MGRPIDLVVLPGCPTFWNAILPTLERGRMARLGLVLLRISMSTSGEWSDTVRLCQRQRPSGDALDVHFWPSCVQALAKELHSGLGALDVQLDAGTLQRLDEILPGPGEAPQAYSW